MTDVLALLVVTGVPAAATLVGGVLALVHRPSTLVASIAFGFAGGTLLATVGLEMLPRALAESGLWATVTALSVGFGTIYTLDVVAHRGIVAGEHADQRRKVERAYRRRPPVAGAGQVLAAATSVEELVEGATIGVSLALAPPLAVVVALAVTLDNVSEGMAIAELFRVDAGGDARRARRPALLWTAAVGVSLFAAAVVAWLLLRDMPVAVHGLLVAAAAGGLLYLTLADLLPEGQQRHYQQSAAVAGGAGFALVLVVSTLVGS